MLVRTWMLGWLWPVVALGYPVESVLTLVPGQDRFVRVGEAATSVGVDDERVAKVELFPTGEALLTGAAPGRALVLVHEAGRLTAHRVVVAGEAAGRGPAAAPGLEASGSGGEELPGQVMKACPGLKLPPKPKSGDAVEGEVQSDTCRQALLRLVASDAYAGVKMSLTFSLEALQAQLADLQRALARAGLPGEVAYAGASLRLPKELSDAQRRRVLELAFSVTIGPVLVDAPLRGAP